MSPARSLRSFRRLALNCFREVFAVWGDVSKFPEIKRTYCLDMDFESFPGLCERFGLTFPKI
jgi:hypothetical protein